MPKETQHKSFYKAVVVPSAAQFLGAPRWPYPLMSAFATFLQLGTLANSILTE